MPTKLEPVVYFVENPDTGLVKIGYTANIRERLTHLRGEHKNPRLRLLATTPGSFQIENLIHLALDDTRDRGEWFNPSEMLTALLNLARVLTPQQAAEQAMIAGAEPPAPPLSIDAVVAVGAEALAYWHEWATAGLL